MANDLLSKKTRRIVKGRQVQWRVQTTRQCKCEGCLTFKNNDSENRWQPVSESKVNIKEACCGNNDEEDNNDYGAEPKVNSGNSNDMPAVVACQRWHSGCWQAAQIKACGGTDFWEKVKVHFGPLISVSNIMDTMPHDDLSLAVPLLVDKDQHRLGCKLRDVETNYSFTSSGSTSSFKTVFHGLNALSGVGILSIPYALSSGGWLSLILLFVISTAAFYTGLLIQRCMDFDSNIRTYPDIGERAFGNKGRILVSVLMYTELYLVSTGFLILEGDNLQNLFPNMGIEVAGFEIGGRQLSVIIVALIILPTVWLDNMSILSYISASGVLASVIILVSIFWTGAFDGVGFKEKGTLVNWHGIPTAVSLYAFCYCAHPVFPTLYTSMKNKHQFSNVMILCFILCSISYASMAVLGYLMFGPNVKSQITLNLPTDKLSSRLTIYTTLVNPITKYALMIMPIVNAAKSWLPVSCEKRPFSIFIGTALVISNVIVALSLPFFGDLMSLVGAFLSMTASIILPSLCYMKISGTYRRFGFEMVVLWTVVLLGVSVVILGTYTSLSEIIRHF